jgi:CRP/FNR family cyclic AMP-dependent transcriptional regulator
VDPATSLCHVLVEDPDLAEAIPEPERRAAAIESCVAPLLQVVSGSWSIPADPGIGALGMLLLDGLLIRKISVGDRFAVMLLGPGDMLRPWPRTGDPGLRAVWRAAGPIRVAMLDRGFTSQLGEYPELGGAIVERLAQRTREMAINLAIASHTRVDARLHMMLWQMAGRFGSVRTDGVLLPVKLTHAMLADIVAARRPTVTTALSALTDRGLVEQTADGWLLKGAPPTSVLDFG